ncbi:hypothetical protein E1163_04515 [Fulvivirga kasyanovii]|uniref:Uncharacterized protein n=2 Tax=Fulvivirga kasyanovii TaxID=396812 RepID=A0ABW9RJR2_9BACT|nr:hypothetical protein [Fulvivirga kasyanovii]
MSTFRSFYGIDGMSDQDKASFGANHLGSAPTPDDRKQIGSFLGGELTANGTFYKFVQTAQYSTDGRMKGAGYVIEQQIDVMYGGTTSSLSFPEESDIWGDIWHSTLARAIVPDVYTLDVSWGATFIALGGSNSYTVNLITRGKDAGIHYTQTQTGYSNQRRNDWRYGFEIDGGINGGHLMYNGDSRELTAAHLLGITQVTSGGFIVGGNFIRGIGDDGRTVMYGVSMGIGETLGFSHGSGITKVKTW